MAQGALVAHQTRWDAPEADNLRPAATTSAVLGTHTESALCADCNQLSTDCSLRSAAIACRPPIRKMNHRSGSADPVSASGSPGRPRPAGAGGRTIPRSAGAVLRPRVRPGSAGRDGRVGELAGAAAPGDVGPGRCGRRGGILAPGRARGSLAGGPCPAVSAGIAVTALPAATLRDVPGAMPVGARGTARGTARRVLPAQPVLSVE